MGNLCLFEQGICAKHLSKKLQLLDIGAVYVSFKTLDFGFDERGIPCIYTG